MNAGSFFRAGQGFALTLALGLTLAASPALFAAAEAPMPGHEVPKGAAADPHAPAAESHGSSNPLSFDPDLALVTATILVILLVVLGKFAWGPIIEGMETRERGIADNIAAAERQNREARQLLVDYEKQLSTAGQQVRDMLDKAQKDADEKADRIVRAAEEAAAAEKDRAVAAIGAAKEMALRQIAEKSVDTAMSLARRVLHKEINAGSHTQLVNEALAQFPRN